MGNMISNVFLGDRSAARMGWMCVVGLGGFIAWAGLVPLQQGIAASGTVIVQNKRQIIQHLEGGIVDRIDVREGQRVARGAVLITLKGTASQAGRDQTVKQVAALQARVQRLSALQDGRGTPDFSALTMLDLKPTDRADIASKERKLFDQQRRALSAELAVLETRRRAALGVGSARAGQAAIASRSLGAARSELNVVSQMADQQLARRDQVAALQRGASGIEGEIARLSSESREASALAGDVSAQAAQVRAQYERQTALELVEARNELRAAEEQLAAAQDVLDRGVIRAPVAGEVLNLAFNTKTGVVRPGEPIMEIVPRDQSVTASVRVRPSDRASISQGQTVRTQITAYRSWLMPQLTGTVTGVSADLKRDEASGESYYEATVRVSGASGGDKDTPGIIPGMPVEVFIFSGISRTTLDYLFEPVFTSLFRGLRAT